MIYIPYKKSLGQNFLSNPRILEKIVAAAELKKEDVVIEVGPGRGDMTKLLAIKAGQVIAIEKDNRLIEILKSKFQISKNVEIIESDVLKFDATCYMLHDFGYKIVANLPYYITSHFLRTVLEEWEPRPELIILVIQKEVAQRILARPPHMNLLALSVQYYAEPKIMGYISKGSFNPVPKVDSAIIKLTTHDKQLTTTETKKLFDLMRIGFSEKRKQLAPVLAKKLGKSKEEIIKNFENLKITPTARPENLSLDDWLKIKEKI